MVLLTVFTVAATKYQVLALMTAGVSMAKAPALGLVPPVTAPALAVLRLKKRNLPAPPSPRLIAQPFWLSSRTKMRWPLAVTSVERIQAVTLNPLVSTGMEGSST